MNAETLHIAICNNYGQLLMKGYDKEIEDDSEMLLYISVKTVLKDLFQEITSSNQLERHLEGNCEDR